MQYKYKCFWVEIIDLIEYDLVDWDDPQGLYKYNIYYNGVCCTTGKRMLESQCKEAAQYWVNTFGYTWLGDENELH